MSKGMSQSKTIVKTPTISANSAYHASDCIGGKMVLTDTMRGDGGAAALINLLVVDIINQKPALEVLIFDADPTVATLTDHAAVALGADVAKVVGIIHVATTDWATVGGMAFASVAVPRVLEGAAGSNNLWATAMVVGTPTYTGTADLTFKFGFMRD